MKHGDLRERIQIREFCGTGRDPLNAPVGVWRNKGTAIWAKRRDVSDGERHSVDAWRQRRVTRFTIRMSSFARSIGRSDRVLHDGAEWAITGIMEVEPGRRFLQLTCEAGIDEG
ncbi:head-tail adaptor protein [Mangrovicoccus sp. HB161399]|uniref:head-tail adaptor protein n=1 Tax=Mangrovicoccus sp. HB161399 TaxID=2720392 RepID=UPI001557AF75|nr:head-tail adaptor protein [Mangrovicoccus sp. HB161399]